jgi:hypothetical protein
MTLSADDLLLGASTTFEVTVPGDVLLPAGDDGSLLSSSGTRTSLAAVVDDNGNATVVLRPLQLADIARIDRAGRQDGTLVSVLMVAQSLVQPAVTVEEVQRMHAGLVEFLLGHVNRISGLRVPADELAEQIQAPLARACFVLAREFGWTPDDCSGLTVGQVLLYLEMFGRGETVDAVGASA